jgi:hypothetical protein
MVFTDRELFIQIMTTMITSSVAKSIPREIRAKQLQVIRDSVCPTVSNSEWSEIANDINQNQDVILTSLATKLKDSKDSKKVMDNATLLELDRAVHDNLSDIDFDKLDMTDAPQEVIEWIKSKKSN